MPVSQVMDDVGVCPGPPGRGRSLLASPLHGGDISRCVWQSGFIPSGQTTSRRQSLRDLPRGMGLCEARAGQASVRGRRLAAGVRPQLPLGVFPLTAGGPPRLSGIITSKSNQLIVGCN